MIKHSVMLTILLLSILLSFSFILNAQAGPVDANRASEIARSFVGKDIIPCEMGSNAKIRIKAASDYQPFHIFNAIDGNGFVIVSGESEMPEIVAYSFSSSIDLENAPLAFCDYLNQYSDMVSAVRNGTATLSLSKHKAEACPVVGPLCKSQWGQDIPYNSLCPKIGGKSCVVGCVATAMSQIMYYYEWPKVGRGSRTYDSGIEGVGLLSSVFSDHKYDWDVMKPTTLENYSSEEASAAVAQLCYDCGVGARMEYGLEGSGTHDDYAMEALFTYFGYKGSSLHKEFRECYATPEDWEAMICTELNGGRPVLMTGYNGDGGHEFIIDGYDSNNFFHVNWGWDGLADGYFSMSLLNPFPDEYYNESNSAIVGIEPDYSGNDHARAQSRVYMQMPPTISKESVSLGVAFSVTCSRFYNVNINARTWNVGGALYDSDGNFVKIINLRIESNEEQLYPGYGYESYNVICILPKQLQEGAYTIRMLFREKGYEDWLFPHMVGGAHLNSIPILVEGGTAYFNKVPTGVENLHSDSRVPVRTAYFDLQGRKLDSSEAPNSKVIIYKEYFEDGTSRNKKVLK